MYNIEDFKKSIAIIRECQAYVRKQVEGINNNDDFPRYIDLIHLSSSRYPTLRGGTDFKLSVCNGDLKVHKLFRDGYQGDSCINTQLSKSGEKLDYYRYAYNETEQSTINLAVVLASNWEQIKTTLSLAIQKYYDDTHKNGSVLDNFKI